MGRRALSLLTAAVACGSPKRGEVAEESPRNEATAAEAEAPTPAEKTKPAPAESSSQHDHLKPSKIPPPPSPPDGAKLEFLEDVRHELAATIVTSKAHHVDRIYESMRGPYYYQRDVPLASGPSKDLKWITGATIQPIDAWEGTPASDEFVCHANVELNRASTRRYEDEFGDRVKIDPRFFTFVPGRLDVRFPDGFGIPVPADSELFLATMALNLNDPDLDVAVRFRTELTLAPPDGPPLRALFRRALYGSVQTDDPIPHPNHVPDGASCAPPPQDVEVEKIHLPGRDTAGTAMHWWVPPGQHRYVTEVTDQMALPFDTAVHYATVHVHPYATQAVFRDKTTGDEIVRFTPQMLEGRRGVAETGEFRSAEGKPAFKDHQYELVVEYDNTTLEYIDAMAILYLYLEDPEFGTHSK